MSFAIRPFPVGGGLLAVVPMPGRGGDLASDMGQVIRYAPALVVSMTALDEMAPSGNMVQRLRAVGIGWRHFPVSDYGVPDMVGAAAWPALSQDIRAVLAAGGRVLLHCMGGCGRSGMVALRLMVEGGETPDVALHRLRAVRPCAVETEAQRVWASDQADRPRP